MTQPDLPKEAVEEAAALIYESWFDGRYWHHATPKARASILAGVHAAAPAIRDDVFNQLRRAARALENDPEADCGTYVHDVECAILRLLRDAS